MGYILDSKLPFVCICIMQPFATEFPVKCTPNKAAFLAEVIAWLKGMEGSTILDSTSAYELDGENVYLCSTKGEELRMRELKRNGDWEAIGFQYDMPDDQGRVWRTEAVLRRDKVSKDEGLIRLRTQCIPKAPGAYITTPKKPYLIKTLLNNKWGTRDGEFDICNSPHWLENSDVDIAVAQLVMSGSAGQRLPIVYISATGHEEWLLTQNEIEKLAYDLEGVAHVLAEPSRNFSMRLRDITEGKNIYNGTVGISLPGRGIIRQFFLGTQFEQISELIECVKTTSINLRGVMPATGWEWSELQEHALRSQQAALRGALSQDDANQLLEDYGKELASLQDENRQLKELINSQTVDNFENDYKKFKSEEISLKICDEIYPGEVSDRIRYAAETALSTKDTKGIDPRTIAVWQSILECIPRSTGLDDLLADIERATKDPNRLAVEVPKLLERHGYCEKGDNKHIRLEPKNGFSGLQSITVPKTPSEIRGLQNQRKQIERTLGIGILPRSTKKYHVQH